MKNLREVSMQEVLSLCRYRLSKGKQAFTLYLPPTSIPPIRPFRRVEVEDTVVGVIYQFYVKPSEKDGGWLVKTRVITKPFNTLPPIGEVVRQSNKQ